MLGGIEIRRRLHDRGASVKAQDFTLLGSADAGTADSAGHTATVQGEGRHRSLLLLFGIPARNGNVFANQCETAQYVSRHVKPTRPHIPDGNFHIIIGIHAEILNLSESRLQLLKQEQCMFMWQRACNEACCGKVPYAKRPTSLCKLKSLGPLLFSNVLITSLKCPCWLNTEQLRDGFSSNRFRSHCKVNMCRKCRCKHLVCSEIIEQVPQKVGGMARSHDLFFGCH